MTSSGKARSIKLKSDEKYQRLFSMDTGTLGIKCGHVRLEPGESVGEHTTGEREEIIVALEGRGVATIGEDGFFDIEKDTALYVPPQKKHDIKNTGSAILGYVFITSVA